MTGRRTSVTPWFPEPEEPDPAHAHTTESTWDWLHRSTHERACEARTFLNFNLSCLSESHADSLKSRLQTQWQSVFFELIVARTLQCLGADLEIEPQIANNRRPDFRALFESGTVVVEATAPSFAQDLQRASEDTDELISIIKTLLPAEFSVWIDQLPRLGPTDSKKQFKKVVRGLFESTRSVHKVHHLNSIVGTEPLKLTLVPRRPGWPAYAGGPGFSFCGDGEPRLRRTIRKKRRQVRAADEPAILAISASELVSSLDDFDRALFGQSITTLNESREPSDVRFQADGVFTLYGAESPTCAAVLAFMEPGFRCSTEPVIYLHPRFAGSLPKELMVLETRRLDPEAGVQTTAPLVPSVLDCLHPVRV